MRLPHSSRIENVAAWVRSVAAQMGAEHHAEGSVALAMLMSRWLLQAQ